MQIRTLSYLVAPAVALLGTIAPFAASADTSYGYGYGTDAYGSYYSDAASYDNNYNQSYDASYYQKSDVNYSASNETAYNVSAQNSQSSASETATYNLYSGGYSDSNWDWNADNGWNRWAIDHMHDHDMCFSSDGRRFSSGDWGRMDFGQKHSGCSMFNRDGYMQMLNTYYASEQSDSSNSYNESYYNKSNVDYSASNVVVASYSSNESSSESSNHDRYGAQDGYNSFGNFSGTERDHRPHRNLDFMRSYSHSW